MNPIGAAIKYKKNKLIFIIPSNHKSLQVSNLQTFVILLDLMNQKSNLLMSDLALFKDVNCRIDV